MPLLPGDKRISVTFNPANAYLTPDVPLQKESAPTTAHELARIMDVLGMGSYAGVVFVGQQASYFLDETGSKIAGYLDAPFDTLNEGYVAANSRFGTPGSGARVAVLLVGANTVETAPVQLCSDYVDIYGAAGSVVSGAAGEPVFIACSGSGMTVEGCEFISNNAPVLTVPAGVAMPNGATFRECTLTNIGPAPALPPEGLFDLHSPLDVPFLFDRCEIRLNNRPLVYFDPNTNTVPLVAVLQNSVLLSSPSTTSIFEGLNYLGVKIRDSALILGGPNAILFSDYSNSGLTVTEIDGLLIRNAVLQNVYPLKLLSNTRYNTINWNRIESSATLLLNPAPFTDASITGDFRNSAFAKLSLASITMTLDGFRLFNTVGDVQLNVVAATPATEFVNVRTLTPLQTPADTTALLTASGAVAAKFFNCTLSYLLFYPLNTTTAVFCGTVIGGQSYGLSNLACLGNPTRQCILRDHSLLAQPFFTNNLLSGTAYPDVQLAGVITNDIPAPILIQGVRSQGVLDSPVIDLSQIPNRYVYAANSEFTAHDSFLQPFFPSIPAIFNPSADQRIFISAGGRFPIENTTARDPGLRSTTYVQQIANRFGPLYLGDPTQATIIQGASFAVSNPRALREALNITYTTLYVRMAGGTTSVDVFNPNFGSWTVLSFVADAGLDNLHLSTVSANLPMTYSYIAENTVRVAIPKPILTVEHLDFVISSLNAQEDASTPTPVTSLDVTQASAIPIPTGVTVFNVTFTPNFTTIPIVIPSLTIPAGNPSIAWTVANESITAYGFTVTLAAPVTVIGYYLNYIAATTA
jgi:hypothetical protein